MTKRLLLLVNNQAPRDMCKENERMNMTNTIHEMRNGVCKPELKIVGNNPEELSDDDILSMTPEEVEIRLRDMDVEIKNEDKLMKDLLEEEYELEERLSVDSIYPGKSFCARSVRRGIHEASVSAEPYFIKGDCGSGKRVVARSIHDHSLARDMIFKHVKCEEIQCADGLKAIFSDKTVGTIYLSDLYLLEKEYQSVVRACVENTEARIISSSQRYLEESVDVGSFCGELLGKLYKKSNVIDIVPLRFRREDIPDNAREIVRCLNPNRVRINISREAHSLLREYQWPGDIKDLFDVMKVAVSNHTEQGGVIVADDLPSKIRPYRYCQIRQGGIVKESAAARYEDIGRMLESEDEAPKRWWEIMKGIHGKVANGN